MLSRKRTNSEEYEVYSIYEIYIPERSEKQKRRQLNPTY